MDFDLVKLYTTLGLGGFGVIVITFIALYLVRYIIKTQEKLVEALESNSKALTSINETLRSLNDTIQADNREARIKRNQIENRIVRIDTKMYNMRHGGGD